METQTTIKSSTNESPLISVVMPAYNCSRYIEQAIDSILNQSFEDFELLILDDASTDSTWKIIQKYQDTRVLSFQNEYNLGYLKSCNKLFDLCRGSYITFQDADDWSRHDRLDKQLKTIIETDGLDLCGSFCKRIYSDELSIPIKYPLKHQDILDSLNRGRTSLFCGASIMFRRNILHSIGTYNMLYDRIGAEDIDWYIRVAEAHKTANIPEFLYSYRQHPKSITKQKHSNPLTKFSSDIALTNHILRSMKTTEPLIQNELLKFLDDNRRSQGHPSQRQKIYEELTYYREIPVFGKPIQKIKACILTAAFTPPITALVARKRKNRATRMAKLWKSMQIEKKLVSVYIPTHNRSHMLEQAVMSVLRQTYHPIEIIIVDDGSKDDTQETLTELSGKYKNIVTIRNKTAEGASAARNKAINIAKGTFITGLDDDDEFLPHRIEDFINQYDNTYSFLCSSHIEETSRGIFKASVRKPYITRELISKKNYVESHIFIETDRVKSVGGYDEKMSAWEDFDLWFRLIDTFGTARKIDNHSYYINQRHNMGSITQDDTHGSGFNQFVKKHEKELTENHIFSLTIADMRIRNTRISIYQIIKCLNRPKHAWEIALLFLRQHIISALKLIKIKKPQPKTTP